MATTKSSEVRSLKGDFMNEPEEHYATLKFGELAVGGRYISLPFPGDNDGHGGFVGAKYIFQKIKPVIPVGSRREFDQDNLPENAVRIRDGVLSNHPDGMSIIRVE